MKRHRFRVSASDRGSPKPLSGSALVDVTVEDANDNRPKFEKDEYMVKLSDKAQRGQFVAQVKAVDEDEVRSLSYSVVGGTGHQFFSVEANSGLATNSIFFCFLFCENSLICLEGKSMTPHQENNFLFRSSQQLPRLCLGPSKGFLS